MLSAAKKTQFTALFRQFVQEYLSQPQGQVHLKQYELNRAQGQKNFEEIQKETLDGHLPTDKVLQNCFRIPTLMHIQNQAFGSSSHRQLPVILKLGSKQ